MLRLPRYNIKIANHIFAVFQDLGHHLLKNCRHGHQPKAHTFEPEQAFMGYECSGVITTLFQQQLMISRC